MMNPRRVKITGARGDWTAEVEGRRLAVIHTTWRNGLHGYHDPMVGAKTDGARYLTFVDALRNHDEVVIQRDAPDGSFAREGYVGVFKFSDLNIADDGAVSLRLVERTASPK